MKVPRITLELHLKQSLNRLQVFKSKLQGHLGGITAELVKNVRDAEKVEQLMKNKLTVGQIISRSTRGLLDMSVGSVIPTEEYLEKVRLVNLAMESITKVSQNPSLKRGPTMESVLSLDRIMTNGANDDASYQDNEGVLMTNTALGGLYSADFSKQYLTSGDFPCARADGHLIGYFWKKEFRAVAFGGVGSGIITDLYAFSSRTKEWKKMMPMPGPRIGSCSCRYKDKIYVFGGSKISTANILSVFYEDLLVYDIKEEVWNTLKGNEKEKGYSFRRFKDGCCTLMNEKVLITGGKNWEGEFLADMQTFSVVQQSWGSISEFYDRGAEYLKSGYANHAIVSIPRDDFAARRNSEVQSNEPAGPTVLYGAPVPGGRINKFDVMLMYGGRNSKGILPGNLIRVMHTSGRVHLTALSVAGSGPGPRYGHTLTHLRRLNILVLIGGYGGNTAQDELETSGCLYLVYLSNNIPLSWIKVHPKLKDPSIRFLSRYGHSAIDIDNKIILFGGLSQQEYIDVCVEEVELFKRRKQPVDAEDHQQVLESPRLEEKN